MFRKELEEPPPHLRVPLDVTPVILPLEDDEFGIRQEIGYQRGVFDGDEVFAADSHEDGALDGGQIFRVYLRLRKHHKGKRSPFFQNPRLELLESGAAFRIEVRTAYGHQRAGAGIFHLQKEGVDATVTPAVNRGLHEAELHDELVEVLGHIGIMIFLKRGILSLSARIGAINPVTRFRQLQGLGPHTFVRAPVSVKKEDRLAVLGPGDGVEKPLSIHLNVAGDFLQATGKRFPATEEQRGEIEETYEPAKELHTR